MSDLSDAEKAAFREIADGITDEQARKILAHDIGMTKRWLRWCAGNGYTPSLSDLVRQMMNRGTPKGRLIASHSAALWRLAQREEFDRERGTDPEG